MVTFWLAEMSGVPLLSVSSSTQTCCVACSLGIVQSGLGNPPPNPPSTPVTRLDWLLIIRASVGMTSFPTFATRKSTSVSFVSCTQRPTRNM